MKHGCNNYQNVQPGYWVKDGIRIEHGQGTYRMKWIEDKMSQDCRYDLKKTDPRCEGCKDK